MQKLQILKILSVWLLLMILSQELSASIDTELKKISYRDRFFLKAFFRDFFLHNALGHVLFFETKPVCLTGFSITPHCQHFFEKSFAKGWVSWKKYEHLFPHPQFLFIEEEVTYGEEKVLHIFLINKTTLTNCLKQHEEVFRNILGNSFLPEEFMAQLEQEKKLYHIIHDDECLLGLILGFGFESSLAFKEQNASLDQNIPYPLWTEHYQGIDIDQPKKCLIFPVGFMGDPHSLEVQNLAQRYASELEELWHKYQQARNTLKLVLEQLCASTPHKAENCHR